MTDRSYLLSQKMSDDTRFCFYSTVLKLTLIIQYSQHFLLYLIYSHLYTSCFSSIFVVLKVMYFCNFFLYSVENSKNLREQISCWLALFLVLCHNTHQNICTWSILPNMVRIQLLKFCADKRN